MRRANTQLLGEIATHEIKPKEDYVTETRTYKLITPLFGGGVEAGKNDPSMLIRATSIRGHLRFWWRATRGGQYNGDLKLMREAENAIWGSAASDKTGGQSKVSIEVKVLSTGSSVDAITHSVDRNKRKYRVKEDIGPTYVTFPMRPDTEPISATPKKVSVQKNVKFKIHLSFPKKLKYDVLAALQTWETFGGLGARSRKGFGVPCRISSELDDRSTIVEIDEYVSDALSYIDAGIWPQGVPFLISDKNLILDEEWTRTIEDYKAFRQYPFPLDRVVLGLPILSLPNNGLPERLASPVLIRPIEVQDGSSFMVLILLNNSGQIKVGQPNNTLIEELFDYMAQEGDDEE